MNFDLDIDNYELKDILYLFELNENFTQNDLKKAKNIVLRLHPDKSGLDPEYFRFYYKTYKILENVIEFKNKSSVKISDEKYVVDNNNERDISYYLTPQVYNDEEIKSFNKKFNELFEKCNAKNDDGYGEWLKNYGTDNEIDEIKKMSNVEWNEKIEFKKKEMKKLIPYDKNIKNINSITNNFLLDQDEVENYTSEIFGRLNYQDLKQAHTETLIPMDCEDFNNLPKFNNVNEYKEYREKFGFTTLSENEALELLHKTNNKEDKDGTMRAYKLAKQTEDLGKIIDKHTKEFFTLLDS